MSDDLIAATPSSRAPLDPDAPGVTSPLPFRPTAPRKRSDGVSLKPASDTKIYKVAIASIALRAKGLTWKDVSAALGMNENTVKTYMKVATARGWTNLSTLVQDQDKLDFVIANKAIENIHQGLGERTDDGALTAGAREMTLETAKGLGLFKSHQVVKGDQTAQVGVALSVHVQLPPNANELSTIKVRPGTLGGVSSVDVPADAELIDSDEP